MEKRRVVITGMGAITPIGNSVAETWESIKAGKSGIDTITHFDASINKVHYAAEVKNFDPALYMDAKDARKMARFSQYAVAASKMALEDANLLGNAEVLEDTGCILGVGIGGFEVTEANCISYYKSGCVKTAPMTIPELIPNEAGGNVCMQFGLHGPCQAVSTACSSGTDALGVAFDMVRSGRIDCCLAGGAESTINEIGIGGFNALDQRNQEPAQDCQNGLLGLTVDTGTGLCLGNAIGAILGDDLDQGVLSNTDAAIGPTGFVSLGNIQGDQFNVLDFHAGLCFISPQGSRWGPPAYMRTVPSGPKKERGEIWTGFNAY